MPVTLTARHLVPGLDKPVSELCLGTAFYHRAIRDKCFAMLDAFVATGGTIVDSGRIYGESEMVLGEWFEARGTREQVVLITKCGHGADHRLPSENFETMVAEELQTSLGLLKTDYVDVYMLHRDNPDVPVNKIVDRLNREIDAGHVRALGASNWTYDRIEAAQAYASRHGLCGFGAISNNLSLAVPSAPFYPGLIATGQVGEKWHQESGVPLIPWSSQARGFFTGRHCPEMRTRPPEELSNFDRLMLEVYCTDDNFGRLARAVDLGVRRGYTAVEVALDWRLHKPYPIIPIVGPQTLDELQSCMKAVSLALTPAEARLLNGEED